MSSRRRPPDAISASLASMTCASTHPPIVTPPSSLPLAPMSIFAPSFFEELPVADTSVACTICDSPLRARDSRKVSAMRSSLVRGIERVQPEMAELARPASIGLGQ